MPHVIIKMYSGRSDEQKQRLAEEIRKTIVSVAGSKEHAVSVAIEEVEADKWVEEVYDKDIMENKENLVIEPGYNPH